MKHRNHKQTFTLVLLGLLAGLAIGGIYSAWECRNVRREAYDWKLKAAYWQFAYDHASNFVATTEWRIK